MYSGVTAAWVRQAFFSTTRFGVYDLVKKELGETETNKLPFHIKLIGTITAGSVAALVACSTELVLIRMQSDGRLPAHLRRNYASPFHAVGSIVRHEGVAGLYRGFPPLLTRGIFVTSAQFSTYDQAKEAITHSEFARTQQWTGDSIFASGFCAGFVAAVVATPIDVIKSRMMNSTKSGQHGNAQVVYKSSMDCLSQTGRNEESVDCFRGLQIKYGSKSAQKAVEIIDKLIGNKQIQTSSLSSVPISISASTS